MWPLWAESFFSKQAQSAEGALSAAVRIWCFWNGLLLYLQLSPQHQKDLYWWARDLQSLPADSMQLPILQTRPRPLQSAWGHLHKHLIMAAAAQ